LVDVLEIQSPIRQFSRVSRAVKMRGMASFRPGHYIYIYILYG
jgi:hypothetical protein